MSHSLPPREERTFEADDLPPLLAAALKAAWADPEDDALWDEVDEACRESDRPEEGAALYSQVMDADQSKAVRIRVGMRAADFCEEWFEETEPVVEMLSRVLDMDPRHDEAFQRLTVLLTVSSEWDKLLEVYDTAIAKEDDEQRRASLLEEAAKVARDFAAQPQKGSDYLKALLMLRLRDDQLAASVERRLDEQGRHADLVEVWTARLAVLDTEAALSTRLDIAARYLDPMGEGESFLSVIAEFLEEGGQQDAACALLDKASVSSALDKPIRMQSLKRLEALQTAAGNVPEVVTALERMLDLTDEVADKIRLHDRAGQLLSQIDRREEALSHLARVIVLDPTLDDTRQRARTLAFEVDRVAKYAQALVSAGEAAERGKRRVELLVEAAGLHARELNEPSVATELYVRLYEDDAADEGVRLLATRELTHLLESLGDQPRLLDFLEKRAELETQPEERKQVLGQAARLAEHLQQAERALGLWKLRLDDDASDVEALSARISLFSQREDHRGLVDSLGARSKLGVDESVQRQDLVQAARVYADSLDELAEAIATWQSVEKRFGRTWETVDELVALSVRAEEFEAAEEVLEESIASLDEAEESRARKVQQLIAQGDIRRHHLKAFAGAIDSYDAALRLAPFDEAARAGLLTLSEHEDCAHQAAETLASALKAAGDQDHLVALLERRLSVAPDDKFRAGVLLEAAGIHEDNGELDEALSCLKRSFALHVSERSEQELHRLAETSGGWETVAQAYAEAIRVASDEDSKRLHLERGRVEEEKVGDAARATLSFGAALEIEPADVDAARSLIRAAHRATQFEQAAHGLVHYCKAVDVVEPELVRHFEACAHEHGRWEETLSALADEIASSELPAKLGHDLKRQLAIWHRDAAGDPDSAELVLRRAVGDYPQEDTLRMLADLQRRAPGKPLVTTLLSLADVTGGELSALREAGDVALFRVNDAELAEPILERAFEEATKRFSAPSERAPDPEAALETLEVDVRSEEEQVCSWAVDHLVDLALNKQQHERAVDLLEESAQLPFAEPERLGRRFRAAEVAAVGDFDQRAVSLGESVLKRDPAHEGAIKLLSSLHEKEGRLDQLLDLRRRELELDRPLERRLFLRLDQARVLGALREPAASRIEVLGDNLADLPGHAETVEALHALLSETENFSALAAMLEEQAAAIAGSTPAQAAAFWERAGRVAEEQLEDRDRLQRDFKQAVTAQPSLPVLDRLAELSRGEEDWNTEVSWLEQRLGLTPDPHSEGVDAEDRRRVVRLLGQALVRCEEYPQARELLEVELSSDPAADGVRRILADLYRVLEEWQELATLLADGVEYAPDHDGSVAYLKAAAGVERRRLNNLEGAIPLLEQAIALDDTDRSLRLQLADCLGEAGEYTRAREILSGLLAEFGRRRSKERAHVHKQLARIARAMGELDEALSQAEEAAKIERTSPSILMLLGQLARGKGELDRAEQAYRTLALIVSRQKAPEEGDEAEVVGESAILFELYQIAQERQHEDQAKELLDSALEVATRNQEESLRLADSLVSLGKLELLLDALALQLERGVEGAARARLLVTRATVLEKNERPDQAFEARLEALAVTPADGKLIDSTRKLAERIEQLPRFWQHLESLANANDGKSSVAGELWLRLGKQAEQEENWMRAAELYERAQATGHKPRRAFLAVDRALGLLDSPERVLAALRRFVEAPGVQENPTTLSNALYRLAEFELAGADPEAVDAEAQQRLRGTGVEHLERALEFDRDDARALSMLRPVVEAGWVTEHTVPLYLRLARSAGDDPILLSALVKAAQLPEVELDLLKEGVELARSLEASGELRFLLSKFIDEARQRDELAEARAALVERADLAQADGDLELMVVLLKDAVSLLSLAEGRELQVRIAEALAGPLGRPQEAIAVYEGLVADVPEQRRIWYPLLGLYRAAGRDDAAAECIGVVENHVESEDDRLLLQMERIRLMIAAERLEEAEEQLKEAIEQHPDSIEAADVLVDLLRKTDRLQELRELLESLFDKARERENGVQVARYGLELARLVSEQDRREAISILTAGLPQTSDNREVLTILLSLYSDEDDPSEKADVLEHLLVIEEGEAAAAIARQLISIREIEGDDFGLGRALELGFEAAPNDEDIVGRYADHLRSQEDFGRLAETLTYRAEHTSDDEKATSFLIEAGRLYQDHLGEPMRAAENLERAFARRPDDLDLLTRASDSYVLGGEIDKALALLGRSIEGGDELILADALDLRAKILVNERGDSIEALAQAAQDLVAAGEQLLPEEQEQELQRRLVEVLERLRQLQGAEGDEEAERRTTTQLARLLVAQGESNAGTETLAAWLRQHPSDLEVAAELGQLASSVQDYSTASFALRLLYESSEGEARREAAVAFADAAAQAGDPMEAREALESAFAESPDDAKVRDRLRSMYEAAGAFDELARLLLAEAEKAEDSQARYALFVEVGDLLLRSGEGSKACEAYERACEVAPEPYEITSKLADAYIGMGDIERARTLLDEAVAEHGKRRSPELGILQHGLARVAEASGDVDAMFTWLEAALMSDRNNGEVASELATRAQDAGRYDIAVKALQILTLSKTEAPISKAEAYFRQGQIALEQGDEKKALLLARRAVSADGTFEPAQELAASLGG